MQIDTIYNSFEGPKVPTVECNALGLRHGMNDHTLKEIEACGVGPIR